MRAVGSGLSTSNCAGRRTGRRDGDGSALLQVIIAAGRRPVFLSSTVRDENDQLQHEARSPLRPARGRNRHLGLAADSEPAQSEALLASR